MYKIYQRCLGEGGNCPQCSTGPPNKNEKKNEIRYERKNQAGDRMRQTRNNENETLQREGKQEARTQIRTL